VHVTDTPLYRDTLGLCGVLLQELDGQSCHERLRIRLADGALRLLDQVTLAIAGHGRRECLEDADAELRALRAQLHLALELELLEEDAFLALAEQADVIGRQLGGWLKKLKQ